MTSAAALARSEPCSGFRPDGLQISRQYAERKDALPSAPDIALVNVPYGTTAQSIRPLGLAALGAYVVSRGIDAKGFDFSDAQAPISQLVDEYKLYQYPAVGLSFYNTNATLGYDVAKLIKARAPSCLVLAGGPHVSAANPSLFERHPEVDIVVRNEGEETLYELLRALTAGRSLMGIKGVSYHQGGDVCVNPDRDRIQDLDQLPAPLFDFEGEADRPIYFYDQETQRLKPAVALVTSRSCPYSCSFCAIISMGRRWRAASGQKVMADLRAIELHQGRHFGHVYFLEANFFVKPSRAVEIAEALAESRPGITFSFSTRVDQLVRAANLIPRLRSLGLRAVELGVESASMGALERFTKGTTPDDNDRALQLLREHNIHLLLDFIQFDAEASLGDLRDNIRFLERTGLDSYVPWDHLVAHMTPYLGTAIRKRYEQLLGHTFDEDHLPDPASLLLDARVRSIFVELRRLLPLMPLLARALSRLEGEEAPDAGHGRETSRRLLNAATIRRLPFVVLRELLKQAESDRQIAFDSALPAFVDDSQEHEFTLEEFLHASLH